MSRQKFVVKKADGFTPVLAGDGLLNLKSPLEFFVPPENEVVIKFGFTANRALLVVESANMRQDGWELVTPNLIYTAGVEPAVRLKNTTKQPMKVNQGEVAVRAAILDAGDTVVELA